MRTIVIGFTVLVLGWLGGCTGASNPEAEAAARSAAETWLALVDEGKYGESWDEAAALFKGAVRREQWEQAAAAVRAPLGGVRGRELKSARYLRSLPSAPDGEYVVIRYTTSYEKKQQAVETVTPMLDHDGQWRVSGYYIK